VTIKHGKIVILVLLTLNCSFGQIEGQATDYKGVFGNNWLKAGRIVSENEIWMKELAEKFNIPYPLAVSVVFPELVRYSALRDKMEITMLKTLYINLGDEYADFSVGQFQMKPSFAEMINEKVWLLKDRQVKHLFKKLSSFSSIRLYRSSIISDLENLKSQFVYLVAFIKICEKEYPVDRMDEEEKVKFLATVYNCGLDKSEDFIWSMSNKKFFTTHLIKGEMYSYSDISLYWYRNNK
jgi:hypothetical protein